jgi:endonuclease/exonuclease/phosphatase family metal-dependent hydrolase
MESQAISGRSFELSPLIHRFSTVSSQARDKSCGVRNRFIALTRGRIARNRMWIALGGVALLTLAFGCTHHRPRSVAISKPAFGPAPGREFSEAGSLRLITFNVWGLPRWINGASAEVERLEPDLVALQEVWTRPARQSVPVSGEWWVAGAAQSRFPFRRTGLVTLSRHPILGGIFFPFRHEAYPDKLVAKGAMKTTLQVGPGVILNLWNVHLQAGARADAVRACQVEELIDWVRHADDNQAADVIAGDFNFGPESPLYTRLTQGLGLVSAASSEGAALVTYDGGGRGGQLCSLDHVFIRLRGGAAGRLGDPETVFTPGTLKERLSDHFGVRVDLRLDAALLAARQEPGRSARFFRPRGPNAAVWLTHAGGGEP